MNLVVNARDAMPTGGSVTLETANLMLDESFVKMHPGAVPGPHVMLAVTDTGSGMDQEVQRHLFEPFFTTKPVGQGTGLGLATVYGIVRQSDGSIWAYSEPGHGTTFKIYLPVSADSPMPTPPAPAPTTVDDGEETVLVVEDEEAVRRLVTSVLAGHGYRVLEADRPAAALAIAAEFAGPIHLLLSDVIMPGGSGPDLAASLISSRPGARVLLMSGYTRDAIVHEGVLHDGVAFVEKPFTPETLLRRVREVLDGPTGP
jgi:CheY-like chemotaxis protein